MKKTIFVVFIAMLFMSCSFVNNKNIVTLRNCTGADLEVEVWLTGVSFILEANEEVELLVSYEISINCRYGVASVFNVQDSNTMELHRDCFYWGEQKKRYWSEK